MFVNLLSNALKFTQRRLEVRIEVGVLLDGDLLVYYVWDNGVGFAMRYVDKLFIVFYRLYWVEEYGGTGIGLATVQRILVRHGGWIWVEVEPDYGATFYFIVGRAVQLKA